MSPRGKKKNLTYIKPSFTFLLLLFEGLEGQEGWGREFICVGDIIQNRLTLN